MQDSNFPQESQEAKGAEMMVRAVHAAIHREILLCFDQKVSLDEMTRRIAHVFEQVLGDVV